MARSDPHAGLLQVIAIFCDFWSFDPGALGLLHAAGANDPEAWVFCNEKVVPAAMPPLFTSIVEDSLRLACYDRALRPAQAYEGDGAGDPARQTGVDDPGYSPPCPTPATSAR